MKSLVRDYASNHPNADYENLVERFGTPHQIAAAYVEEMAVSEIMNNLQFSRKVVKIAVAAAATVVLVWLGAVTIALIHGYKSTSGQIDVTVTVEERIEIPEEE